MQRGEEMTRETRGRRARLVFALASLLLIALILMNLMMGSSAISPTDVLTTLTGASADPTLATILFDIRLPRLIAAGLEGAALALAGLLLQTFFSNPIAGPFVLGISQGAKLAISILLVLVVGSTGILYSWMSILASIVGSISVMLVTLAISKRVHSNAMLVVSGVMVGYVANAASDLVVNFASDASVATLRMWGLGSFSGTSWSDVAWISSIVGVCALAALLLVKPLGAYLFGERYATELGVDVVRFRRQLIILSSVLAATVTAFAGPISFVGVAVPHLARRALDTAKPALTVPATLMLGASFTLAADLVARCAFAPTEISVSTVTAVVGAPVVLSVLMGRKGRDL